MNGSTDAGNIWDGLVSIQFCVRDNSRQVIRSNTTLCVPTKSNADGLIACLDSALHVLGVDNVWQWVCTFCWGYACICGWWYRLCSCKHLGTKWHERKVTTELPWLMWTWCYSYQLELGCKDAFCSQTLMTRYLEFTIFMPSCLKCPES